MCLSDQVYNVTGPFLLGVGSALRLCGITSCVLWVLSAGAGPNFMEWGGTSGALTNVCTHVFSIYFNITVSCSFLQSCVYIHWADTFNQTDSEIIKINSLNTQNTTEWDQTNSI